jgi:hypothetical protein
MGELGFVPTGERERVRILVPSRSRWVDVVVDGLRPRDCFLETGELASEVNGDSRRAPPFHLTALAPVVLHHNLRQNVHQEHEALA